MQPFATCTPRPPSFRRLIIGGRLIAVAIVAFLLTAATAALAQRGPALVEVSPAIEMEIAPGRALVGSIMPRRRSVIGSAVEGRVDELPYRAGERVPAGEAVSELKKKTISILVAAAKAAYDAAEWEYKKAVEGPRKEERDEAEARKKAAQARFDFVQSRFKRVQRLRDRNAATENELEEALSVYLAAKHTLDAETAAAALVDEGTRKEDIAIAKARMMAAQEEHNRLVDRKTKYTAKAPFAGYVAKEHTQVGEWLKDGDPVVELVELDFVEVEAFVPQRYIRYVEPGTSITVTVEGVLDKPLTGKVSRIVPQADTRTRTFPVKVELQNVFNGDQPALREGMLARVTLPVGERRMAVAVPKDALVLGGKSPVIYVFEGSKVRMVPVDLGAAEQGMVEVRGELKPGAQVVVKGNERLRPGQEAKKVGDVPTSRYLGDE